jgi:hypothetical protein
MDRKTSKVLTIHGQHHPWADIDHLYVPREEGGKGLMQTEGSYTAEVRILREYVESKDSLLVDTSTSHKLNTSSNS